MILNSTRGSADETSYWRYVADIVINMNYQSDSEYFTREIEIEKARYQPHVWGKHQLKFVEPFTEHREHERDREENLYKISRKRYHPYRDRGGIFIYPSIHYYLSEYKRKSPTEITGRYSSSLQDQLDPFLKSLSEDEIKKLNTAIRNNDPTEPLWGSDKAGFPRGRCTGFIGMRGGHKSHLGYLSILSKIIRPESNERALIVSLRDDEDMAEKTLERILANETDYKGRFIDLKEQDKIEILYFPPGYVTPEEFFHRVFMSIQRLKAYPGNPNVIMLFNSLDQLSSRFPLCAAQQIFIPGLIATLRAENITSFFIAVEEPGQPPEHYGLLSMADALITFAREKIKKDQYLGHLEYSLGSKKGSITSDKISDISETQHIVALRIVRFSGGRAAGDGGLLELIHPDDPKADLYKDRLKNENKSLKTGLVFIPFSPSYEEGECLVRDWAIK